LGAFAVRELIAGNGGNIAGCVKSAIALTPLEEAVAFEKQISPELCELARIMEQ